MEKTTKALILSNHQIDDLLLYSLETAFDFDVTIVRNWDQLIDNLVEEQYSLVVCNFANDEKLFMLAREYFLTVDRNYLLVFIHPSPSDTAENNDIHYVPIDKLPLSLNKLIIYFFKRDDDSKVFGYSKIMVKTLMRFTELPFPVFLKLNSRYLKVLSVGDVFYTSDVDKYSQKGIERLYINKAVGNWVLVEIHRRMKYILNNPDQQISVPPPPEDFDGNITDQMLKTAEDDGEFETSATTTTAPVTEDTVEETEQRLNVPSSPPLLQENAGNVFILEETHVVEIKNYLKNIVHVVKKNPEISKLLKMLKISRDSSDYYFSHIGTLINISIAIAMNLEWRTEKTIEKLVYACYFHDVGLSEKPELAKIKNEEDMVLQNISDEEIQLIHDHPSKAATLIKNIKEFPEDVYVIVEQHHELPDGTGFPRGLNSNRITPMATVFIVAHDLVDYLIDFQDWDIQTYLQERESIFTGSNFRKVLLSLKNIKISANDLIVQDSQKT
ncbi:MAG: HD domain-containing protein [Oligoflexia bacterium]|nr:HD domain-containing protein [Oligoflexia bacterium]